MSKKALTAKEKKILFQIKRLVSQEFEIDKLFFYGSRVDGTATHFSDYDILIITKKDMDWHQKRRISDLTLEVDIEYDVVTDIKVYSKNDIKNSLLGHTPFMENVISQGLIYE